MSVRVSHALLALVVGTALLALAPACSDAPARADDAPRKPAQLLDTRASLRVRVAPVVLAPLDPEAETSGVVSAFRSARVAAEVAGRIVARHVEPGAVVAEGDLLVALDATQLDVAVAEARATLAAREVDLAEAQRELARADELRTRGALSESRHEGLGFAVERAVSARTLAHAQLRRAQRTREDASVRAPFAGTVEAVDVHVGDYLAPGAPVALVADFTRVRVRAGVTAREAASLAPGGQVSLTVAALGGHRFAASIHSIGRTADASTGTYPVEVWLDNQDGRLREGMVARVALQPEQADAVLSVPRAALVRRGSQLSVFVVEGKPGALDAHVRAVRVGRQGRDSVELLDGVAEGERVVVEGQFALSDGAPVVIDDATPIVTDGTAAPGA